MSEYMFAAETGKLSQREEKRLERIARAASVEFSERVDFNYVNLPGNGWRRWFAVDDRGTPMTKNVEAFVLRRLES